MSTATSTAPVMSVETLLIQADAGAQVGAGHLMRCFALAEAWRDRGGAVAIVVPEDLPAGLVARIIAEGCETVTSAEPDGAWLARQAEGRGADWIVIDGYRFDTEFLLAAGSTGRPILMLDDDARHADYPVRTILNQNLHARAEDYVGKTQAHLMLGPRHALIRRDLRAWKGWSRSIQGNARNVLITLGGADPGAHTGRALRAMLAMRERSPNLDLQVHAVVGAANPRLDALRHLAESHEWIQISWDVRDMGEEIRWCDLALSASGSTVWELAMFQTPMLLGTASAVEEPVAASMNAAGAAEVLGRLEDRSVEEISAAVEGLMRDRGALARLSAGAANLVDGDGAFLVIDQMLAISRRSG